MSRHYKGLPGTNHLPHFHDHGNAQVMCPTIAYRAGRVGEGPIIQASRMDISGLREGVKLILLLGVVLGIVWKKVAFGEFAPKKSSGTGLTNGSACEVISGSVLDFAKNKAGSHGIVCAAQ